jgi:lysozyme
MMTPDMMSKLRRSLIEHEGLKKFPYVDTVGKITIGIGYNLTDRGVSDEWINHQYAEDVSYFYSKLCEFHWFKILNEDRQIVLIDMSFIGWKKMLEFKNMFKSLENGDYFGAAQEMLDSEWANQVKERAAKLAEGMKTGVYLI